jgi:hypothetical protein
MTNPIAVAVEQTARKTFVTAIDWPGWSRSAKTLPEALESLLAYAPRYAPIARSAGYPLPEDLETEVFETSDGNGGTEFGVPSLVTEADRRSTSAADGQRLAALVDAAWSFLDKVVKAAPEDLRKGPRGGGRNTAKIVSHTLEADHGYSKAMGLKVPAPTPGDRPAIDALRSSILEVIAEPSDGSQLGGGRWTVRYAAHRIAWHSLDHAWEIQDKSKPEAPAS